MFNKHISICVILMIISFQSFSQNPNQSFAKGDYDECIKICDRILETNPNNETANFFKGASLVKLKKYDQAKTYLTNAEKNEYQPKIAVKANLLTVQAGLQQTDLVLESLENMANNGFGALFVLKNEEFNYLGNNNDFNNLKSKVDANSNPCKYGDEYKRLDFWIGEWDVFVNNTKIGTSSITKSEGGCTLYEDYKTFTGFLGRSTNYYDPTDKLHTQLWIDKFNSITIFKELKSKKGYLQMSAVKGEGNLSRMTYVQDSIDDTVTQTMEGSSDDGKTWSTNFVGVYKRKINNIEKTN